MRQGKRAGSCGREEFSYYFSLVSDGFILYTHFEVKTQFI